MSENRVDSGRSAYSSGFTRHITRNAARGYAVLGIVFVAVSIAVFAIPFEKNTTFWVAYAFTVVAFAAQIFIWRARLAQGSGGSARVTPLKSKFLGLPLVHVGVVYLFLQLIALAAFSAVPGLPMWVSVLACALLAAIAGVCLIGVDAAREEIERVDQKVERKISCLKALQANVELLAKQEADASTKEELATLAQKIRFSDPMSSEELADLEEEIASKVDALGSSGAAVLPEQKRAAIAEISQLIDERNAKCKVLK